MEILHLAFTVLFYLLFVSVAYFLLFATAALLKSPSKTKTGAQPHNKMAVFIPSYKEDAVIVQVAKRAVEQSYPSENYTVAVIADSLQDETLEKLRQLPIETVVVDFEKSTKSKALCAGMDHLGNDFDIACVLDADNIMERDFLEKINTAFNQGFRAVQGHRTAKNTNTAFALLDAASEEINNSIFRKGHRALGLSSALIGSGLAVEYALYKKLMNNIDSTAEDKELELILTRSKIKIEYLNDAYVYDEKVQEKAVFENQRRRWLSAQFLYFRRSFLPALWHLVSRANVSYFDKSLQMILPPRSIALGLTGLFWILSIASNLIWPELLDYHYLSYTYWSTLMGMMILALLFAIPGWMYNRKLAKALLSLPGSILSMFLLLFKLKGATKKFIHTTHSYTSNEDE